MSDDASSSTPAPPPDDGGIRVSTPALRTLVYGTVFIVLIWASVEFVKHGADPSVLTPILKLFKP